MNHRDDTTYLAAKRPRLEQRARALAAVRDGFSRRGFLEVETPVRIPHPAPEEHIDPEPSGDWFLAASPELQMKRLVAASYERIFQVGHCFRHGERGDRHLPEFTMIEWYRTGGTLADLRADCIDIVQDAARALGCFPRLSYRGTPIDLEPPWPRWDIQEAFARHAGWVPGASPDPVAFDMDLVDKVEPALPPDRPVFVDGYPASAASLARLSPTDPTRALRMELYIAGIELANGFEELTDPVEQRRRFAAEVQRRRAAGKPTAGMDERFLTSLDSLPPCAGMALGFDRLIMVLTDAPRIDDVVAFTCDDL